MRLWIPCSSASFPCFGTQGIPSQTIEFAPEAMDWSAVNWVSLSVLTGGAFLSAFIGGFIGRRNYTLTAFLSAIIFAAIYVGWSGYLKQQLGQVDAFREEAQQGPAVTSPTKNETPSSTEMEEKAQ
jgi:hypothetical protein